MWSYYAAARTVVTRRSTKKPSSSSLAAASSTIIMNHYQNFCSWGGKHKRRDEPTVQRRHGRRPQKENFAETILRPAAEGRLNKKHQSGIPKLAARKQKARLTPILAADRSKTLIMNRALEETEYDDETMEEEATSYVRRSAAATAQEYAFSTSDDDDDDDDDENDDVDDDYYAPELMDDVKYYWVEEDYDVWSTPEVDNVLKFDSVTMEYDPEEDGAGPDDDDFSILDELDEARMARLEELENEKGTYAEASNEDESDVVELGVAGKKKKKRKKTDKEEVHERKLSDTLLDESADLDISEPERQFFYDQEDILQLATTIGPEDKVDGPPEGYDEILPLRDHGPELEDFLEAMIEHPTRYAQITKDYLHPDSMREPKPSFPKNRMNPPEDFVQRYARFLYVSGLPQLEVDGEQGDLKNPLHRHILQKSIGRVVGVELDRVFPASLSSGFVGFDTPKDLGQALASGPLESIISSPPYLKRYRASSEVDGPDFCKESPECIVELCSIPPGNTPTSLHRVLFPRGTELETIYGGISLDRFYFLTPTHVLIRFHSREEAETVVASALVRERLKKLGEYPVHYFRARRELVHDRWEGPGRYEEMRKMGPRLIVDGDMPTKPFYLSHVRCLHLRNLDPTLSKEDITAAFQPYCHRRRDVHGSVEIVTSHFGLPAGCAFVGFETTGEAESILEATSGMMQLGDRKVQLRLVKDRRVPGVDYVQPEMRSHRPVEVLLDDLDNWEKYVDSEDIKLLEDAGISKVVLSEALRGIRYKNPTFGPLDSTMRSDSLLPETQSGEQYKELVQMYIETLKRLIPSHDNVGDMYEAMHFPDEPVDLGIFDSEKRRLEELMKRRLNP